MSEKLLLDADPGCDDSLALSLALTHPEIEVVGVTIVNGNTTVDNGTENALSLLEYLDRGDIPVYKGADRPFVEEPVYAEWIHGTGGLPDSVQNRLPDPQTGPETQHAVDFIIEQAKTHGEDLTIAAIGPATNIALALAKDPSITREVKDIYLMGGALKTTGNVTPMASFNFYVDPDAAARVVQDAYPRIVGLDVTEAVWIPLDMIRSLNGQKPYSVVKDLFRFSEEEVAEKWGEEGVIASDTVVIGDMVDQVIEYEDAYVAVETSESKCRGATIFDEHGVYQEEANCKAAVDIDRERYRNFVLDTLSNLG